MFDKLTTGQAARFLMVAPRTVMKWCDHGRLRHVKEEGTNNRMIAPADLVQFMRDYNMDPPDELLALVNAVERIKASQ